MRLLRSLRLLLFPILAFIIGGTMLVDSRETRQRAALVQQQPTKIRCADLIADGPPADNRHVQITEVEFGDIFARHNKSKSDRWSCVLIPMYAANVAPRGDGSDVRLVARICVEDAVELEDFLARPQVVGCVWDTFRGQRFYDMLLHDTFPNLDSNAYRTVFLGDQLPTIATAQREQWIGVGLIGVGVLLLAWLLWRTWQRERVLRDDGWYAEEDPRDSFQFDRNRSDQDLPSAQANWAIALRTWAFYVNTAAIPVMGSCYLMMRFKLAPDIVTTVGMLVGALMLMVGGGFFVWSYGKFVEQSYQSIPTKQLSQSARRHFDTLTGDLESWGFTFLGDLRVIDRIRASVRVLLSPDGKTAATLEYVFGSSAFNFYTVTPDGMLLHSCSVDLERALDTPLPSRCYWLSSMDVASGYGEHARLVAQYLAKQGIVEAVDIEPEWITGVLDYAHRISGWAMREGGHSKRGVPPLPRPERMIQWHDGRAKFTWRAVANEVSFDAEALAQWRGELEACRAYGVSDADSSPILSLDGDSSFPRAESSRW